MSSLNNPFPAPGADNVHKAIQEGGTLEIKYVRGFVSKSFTRVKRSMVKSQKWQNYKIVLRVTSWMYIKRVGTLKTTKEREKSPTFVRKYLYSEESFFGVGTYVNPPQYSTRGVSRGVQRFLALNGDFSCNTLCACSIYYSESPFSHVRIETSWAHISTCILACELGVFKILKLQWAKA